MYTSTNAEDTVLAAASQNTSRDYRGSLLKTLTKAAFAGVLFLSSMYCLLAYIPSTYYAFIQATFMDWMPVFARVQPYLFMVTFLLTGISVWNRFGTRKTHIITTEFYVIGICTGVYLVWGRPVQFLRNNTLSFLWSLAFLLPIIVLGTLEYISDLDKLPAAGKQLNSPSYPRVIAVALWISLIYPGTSFLRFVIAGMATPLNRQELVIWLSTSFIHVLLFLIFFGIIELGGLIAGRSDNPARMRFLAYTVLAWAGVSFALLKIVLASIPFAGIEATVYACAFSLALVTVAGGWMLQHRVKRTAAEDSARLRDNPYYSAACLLLVFALALIVPLLIGPMDWHSVLEKIWAVTLWTMTAILLLHPRKARERPAWAVTAMILLCFAVLRAGSSQKIWSAVFPGVDRHSVFERHAVFDASYAAASDLLTPANSLPCNQNCEFIAHQTNIPASASVDLHDLSLVQNLQPVAGPRPDIFVIVVDSLRRDYLSPYNPQVFFTPEIGAFAKDSVVFTNAFTRYAGTTLSEPAIWSGTMQLHKHYVQPFHRVNNLEKMIQLDGYKSMATVDTVLRVLLQPQPDLVQLDQAAEKWTDVDFCSTEKEITNRLSQRTDRNKPVFIYTQPQNIHLVTLQKTGRLRPPKKQYAPFFEYYSSELERLDGCFGDFVRTLKEQGRYENSIIVLSADHGEALDKMGAERHAFSLKPEVIRIPLIIHLPRKVRESWYYDPDLIAFNTDVTPSLYELLGHGPVIARPEFGRPLFTRTRADSEKYKQGSYLIASSYGFLYGLLSDNGDKLFVDNEGQDEFFDLRQDPGAKHALMTEQLQQQGEATLAGDIQAIANLYGYRYKAPNLLDWLMR